jgi:hypothetical protein
VGITEERKVSKGSKSTINFNLQKETTCHI